jgi:hypothetical protein
MSHMLARSIAGLAGMLLSLPALGASGLLVAASGESTLRLRVDAGEARVERTGSSTVWRLPQGAAIDAFVASGTGWLAVGSVPVTGGRELALWQGDGSVPEVESLPAPPGRSGAERVSAVPLVDGGGLVGLAWLEGEASDRFGVRASAWDGRRWGPALAVAAPGAGSQLGLTAAVLADGSWLLAWSGFDGEDDEVLWSQQRKGRWTPPRQVAVGNHVPDVTPALRADGDGALLAWSSYDGNDYRLLLARFAGGRWGKPTPAGGPGTILPRWQGEELSFRDAARGAWVAASVDANDALRVEAAAAAPAEPRPILARENGRLRLLFP